MKPFLRNVDSWRGAVRLTSFVCALTALGTASARAQEAPYAEAQYATLTGSTNVINVTMLPVVTASGIVYKNVTVPLEVTVSNAGVVTLTTGTPTVVAAPTSIVSNFVAGPYAGPGVTGTNETQLLTLAGPGVTSGGATEWSVKTTPGATGCTFPTTATFYVGPLPSNPLYPRLQKAGITSTAYSYGVMGSQVCDAEGASAWWYQGNIVGFSQTGNALTIVSFTYTNPKTSPRLKPRSPIPFNNRTDRGWLSTAKLNLQ
jgi:hypothetical protein